MTVKVAKSFDLTLGDVCVSIRPPQLTRKWQTTFHLDVDPLAFVDSQIAHFPGYLDLDVRILGLALIGITVWDKFEAAMDEER